MTTLLTPVRFDGGWVSKPECQWFRLMGAKAASASSRGATPRSMRQIELFIEGARIRSRPNSCPRGVHSILACTARGLNIRTAIRAA
jgi:hypothetical protein